MLLPLAAFTAATSTLLSQDGQGTSLSKCEAKKAKPRPIMRVCEKDVDDLVRALLKDPAVNIPLIPDAIEAQLYKSTIQLTINAVFWLVSRLHGVKILSHEIDLTLDRGALKSFSRRSSNMSQALADGAARHVNDEILKEVADRLLENPAVNSSWIPDSIEHQIYTSCLLVVFRVLQVVLASFRICICGHTLTLNLSADPASVGYSLEQKALNLVKSYTSPKERAFSSIDLDILRKKAREAGIDDQNRDWFWNRIFTRSNFVEQLHLTLYGLILSVLDDIFDENLQVHLLSDAIQLDLVPATPEDDQEKANIEEAAESNESAGSFAAAAFAAGMGVGMSLMAVLTKSQD